MADRIKICLIAAGIIILLNNLFPDEIRCIVEKTGADEDYSVKQVVSAASSGWKNTENVLADILKTDDK